MGRKARLAMLGGLAVGVGSALMKRRDQLMRLVRGGSSDSDPEDGFRSAGYDTVAPPVTEGASSSTSEVTAAPADDSDDVDSGATTASADESEPAASDPQSSSDAADSADGPRGRSGDE